MSRAEKVQILRLERDQARAINRGDIRGATKMFRRGFIGFSSTKHRRIRGLTSLANTFRWYRKHSPKMKYRVEKPHIHVAGDTAVATFYWTVDLGRDHKVHGRGTHVFMKEGRDWKVIHEHFSRAH